VPQARLVPLVLQDSLALWVFQEFRVRKVLWVIPGHLVNLGLQVNLDSLVNKDNLVILERVEHREGLEQQVQLGRLGLPDCRVPLEALD